MRFRAAPFGLLLSFILAGCGASQGSATATTAAPLSKPPVANVNGLGSLPASFARACGKIGEPVSVSSTPSSCQHLLAQYNLSVAPPYWILSAAPKPPVVINETGGKVSQVQAQTWADDLYRDQIWTQFAEKFAQRDFFQKIQIPQLWEAPFDNIFSAGGTVSVPDCYLFPTKLKLFPVNSQARAYFTSSVFALPTYARYSFVGLFSPPKGGSCSIEEVSPAGQLTQFSSLNKPVWAFMPGEVLTDPVLGELWFQDSAGSCADPIATTRPPASWCVSP